MIVRVGGYSENVLGQKSWLFYKLGDGCLFLLFPHRRKKQPTLLLGLSKDHVLVSVEEQRALGPPSTLEPFGHWPCKI